MAWEDEAIEEPRFRRVKRSVPVSGSALPGMPLEMVDPDDESSPTAGSRLERPRNPWWRPASTFGRVALGLAFLSVLGGLAASAFLLKTYLGRDSRFRIAGAGNIEAVGLTEVSRAEMLPVFGEDIGRNIFFVPLAERRKQLEELAWVERATVMRLLPDRIRVQVVERQPVAFTRQGQQIGLVDASGVLLSMPVAMMAQRHYSFPVVTGIDPRDPIESRKARMGVYARLLSELDANGERLSEQISEIDLTDPEDARVLMPEQGADILAHFGEDRFMERYQRYKAHIAEWRQQYPKLSAVDLRYDQQVVLEMAPGTSAVQATVGDGVTPETDPGKQTAEKVSGQAAGDAGGKPKAGSRSVAASKLAENKLEEKKASQAKVAQGDAAKTGVAPDKSAVQAKKLNAAAKLPENSSSRQLSPAAKALTAKDKAAKARKKRTESRKATLNAAKRKPSPTHPATAEGQ